jgi:4a-hydroxytetrahydrobiopterin dehydratase
MKKLAQDELEKHLAGPPLEGWKIVAGKLHREYKFPDFSSAFGFMSIASLSIAEMNHHPEWSNVYDRVVVDLTTHDAGGITQKDVDLARMMESLASKLR